MQSDLDSFSRREFVRWTVAGLAAIGTQSVAGSVVGQEQQHPLPHLLELRALAGHIGRIKRKKPVCLRQV